MRLPWKPKKQSLDSQKPSEIGFGLKSLHDSEDCVVECVYILFLLQTPGLRIPVDELGNALATD